MTALLRQLFLRDFGLKLFSFALAVLIWLIVSFVLKKEPNAVRPLTLTPAEHTFSNLPVLVMSSAEDPRSFKVYPNEVEVTVQGDARVLQRLQPKDIRVMVDLSGIGAAHDLKKRIEVSTPAGVTHSRVYPQEVQVIFPPS